MHKKRIVLEDGRYLIYYTFDKPDLRQGTNAEHKQQEPERCGGKKQCQN